MSVATSLRWRVHVPTADATVVRVVAPAASDRGPWPLMRVLSELQRLGARRLDRPHAVGAGRGVPLIHRETLRWHEMDLTVEAHHGAGAADEVALHLPPWDELDSLIHEDDLWELVDATAMACGASYGSIGDGEALAASLPQGTIVDELRRHIGLLLREEDAEFVPAAAACQYRVLGGSGLSVVLR